MRSEYRDLVAYQRATAVAADMYAAVSRWSSLDRWSTGVQLTRAADSIEANIAEAAGTSDRLTGVARALSGLINRWGSA